jgi:hypothetical protein
MERAVLAERFADASAATLAYARTFVLDELPNALTFELHDKLVSARQAVSALWRDGRIPTWVNLTVVRVAGDQTVIRIDHGAFTANEAHCHPSPFVPFQIRGPYVPNDWVRGERFWLLPP